MQKKKQNSATEDTATGPPSAGSKSSLVAQEYALVPVGDLKPHPANPRRGNTAAIDNSIAQNGFYGAVVAQKSTGFILAGRHRWERAQAAEIVTVPVLWAEVDDPTALRIIAADNRTSDLAGYDEQKLAELLESIRSESGGFEGTGYDQETFDAIVQSAGDAILAATGESAEGFRESGGVGRTPLIVEDEPPQVDRAEELLAKWKVERGQIWEIGRHRLLCGDSTSETDVNALMRGDRAGLMNTDPPYGVSYDNSERPNPGVAKPRVAKDELRDEQLQDFLEAAFRAAKLVLLPNAAWYLWHAHLTQGFFAAAAAAAAAAQVSLHRQIIWVKPVLLLGRGQYHWKHEPCFMGWVKGYPPPDYGLGAGERTQTTIWDIKSVSQAERKEFNHATPKPVELFSIPIVKHLKPGELCYEPFAGSGPQFVAAEHSGVCCRGLEIEPRYCAVILERMQKLGIEPKLAG